MYVQSADAPRRKPVTVPGLRSMKARGEKIVVLTCYDASFAAHMEAAGVDVALVSAGGAAYVVALFATGFRVRDLRGV